MQRSAKRVLTSNTSAKKDEGESAVKRIKKTAAQSNTLFNYFGSNKKTEPTEKSTVQNSILSYFITKTEPEVKTEPAVKTEHKIKTAEFIPTYEIVKDSIDSLEENEFIKKETVKTEEQKNFLSLFNSVKTEPKKVINVTETDYSTENKSTSKENRKCPFYKRIEGTKIVVDAFSYGEIENANAYFLSHFHYDHFIGLNKHFKQIMYCSQITANLVMKQIKVEKSYIKILEYNKFVNVYENNNDIQVCLIDANHCPGSVMFLFRLNKLKKYILHTGDFRASDELVNSLVLRSIKIDIIYLDTTYLDSYYKFLPQSEIIQLGIDLVRKELANKPNTLIVCGSYTIGKERIFIGIAESLNLKVYVTREKKNIIDCLNDSNLSKRITQNPNETNLHVIPMGKLNIKDLESYASKLDKFEHVIALKPSGWTHDSASTTDGLCVVKKSNNIIIYGLEYSEHSSFDELQNCIKSLKPKRVIPTVNIGKKDTREKMESYLKQWLLN